MGFVGGKDEISVNMEICNGGKLHLEDCNQAEVLDRGRGLVH